MSATTLKIARARIADCLQRDQNGQLVQRRDYLNLSGLELRDDELRAPFDPHDRGLPEISLADLHHLRYLDLTGNDLAELPECITQFTRLVWLGLNFNRVERLPDTIGALQNLQRLCLRGNALTELPAGVGKLSALVELDLTGCRIARLPSSMARLEVLEHLVIEDELLAPDLRAVWKDRSWNVLREHLARAAEERSTTQFVAKVVLVGPQENGKTCLQRALRNQEFIAGLKSTDGMSRERLHLRLNGGFVSLSERTTMPGPREDVIDLTLWDMGGQEVYQHAHQMFFTPSGIYLVVTLPRQGGGVQQIDKWIELVKRRTSGEATVVVVTTWCRKYGVDEALTLAELQAKHGDMVQAVVAIDSQDGTGQTSANSSQAWCKSVGLSALTHGFRAGPKCWPTSPVRRRRSCAGQTSAAFAATTALPTPPSSGKLSAPAITSALCFGERTFRRAKMWSFSTRTGSAGRWRASSMTKRHRKPNRERVAVHLRRLLLRWRDLRLQRHVRPLLFQRSNPSARREISKFGFGCPTLTVPVGCSRTAKYAK